MTRSEKAIQALHTISSPVITHSTDAKFQERVVFRVEVRRAASVAKASKPVFGCQLTLAESLPFNEVILLRPNDTLGWLDHNRLDHLRIKRCTDAANICHETIDQYFCAENGLFSPIVAMYAVFYAKDNTQIKEQGVMVFTPAPQEAQERTALTH